MTDKKGKTKYGKLNTVVFECILTVRSTTNALNKWTCKITSFWRAALKGMDIIEGLAVIIITDNFHGFLYQVSI